MDPFFWSPADHMALALRKETQGYTCLSWMGHDRSSSHSLTDDPGAAERREFLLDLLAPCAGKTYQIEWPGGCPSSDGCPYLHVHIASCASIRAATAEAGGDDSEYLRRHGWPEFGGLGELPEDIEHILLIRTGPDNPGISLEITPGVGPPHPFLELELDVTPFAAPGSPR
jgi:hypothetical protein